MDPIRTTAAHDVRRQVRLQSTKTREHLPLIRRGSHSRWYPQGPRRSTRIARWSGNAQVHRDSLRVLKEGRCSPPCVVGKNQKTGETIVLWATRRVSFRSNRRCQNCRAANIGNGSAIPKPTGVTSVHKPATGANAGSWADRNFSWCYSRKEGTTLPPGLLPSSKEGNACAL